MTWTVGDRALLEGGGSHVPEGASYSHLLAVLAKSHVDDAFLEDPDFKGTFIAPNDTAAVYLL
eukprot:1161676-Pelagomonas_calceolata.AAC.17